MKRLLLISPLAPGSLFGGDFFFRLPCLSLLKVAALTPPEWEVVVIDERVETIDFNQGADLVGLTAMTCSVLRAYEIADRFRARGIRVVMGGMHVSTLPEEALAHCDSVVVAEAEGLWSRVLGDFQEGRLQRVYRQDDALPSLAKLPEANWELVRDKGYLPVHFVEATRGCPLDCEFCAVTTFFGGAYRNRPLDDVFAELRRLRPFEGRCIMKNVVFFVDDNIVGNRAYAREFFSRLAELQIRWLGQASVNLADDPEILRLCQRSGCMGVMIGFETLSAQTMKSIGRKSRLRMDYEEAIRKIHDHGIGIDGSFVFGFDNDDEGVFDRTLEFVVRNRIEVPYFSILTPYPGTRLHDRLSRENRILTWDWSLYDTSHVVMQPARLSPDQLQEGYLRVFREAYSLGNLWRRLWGTGSSRTFFYPMNFGFRQGINQLWRGRRSSAPVAARN
ncbi:MAG: B12-binding domain-containing radical SAM protein [Limisphaerales bacterium]